MKTLLVCRCSDKWQSYAPFVLRIAVGLLFLMHGWQKLQGDSAVGFFTQIGIPAAAFFGPLVTWLEIIGGIALILGLFTHWVSKLLAINMLVAILMVHLKSLNAGLPGGFLVSNGGMELALLALAAVISLMITGPGKWALDTHLSKKEMH